MARTKPLFYGGVNVETTGNFHRSGTSSFIRFYFDCATDSLELTNITNHSDAKYRGLSETLVGQTLVASTQFPSGTIITEVDIIGETVTVSSLPAAAGSNRLARVSPPKGQHFVASGSFTRPTSGVGTSDFDARTDLTGSHDTNFDPVNGRKMVMLAVQAKTTDASTQIDGSFALYEVSRVFERTNSSQASFYITSSVNGLFGEEADKQPWTFNNAIIYEVSDSSSLPPLIDGNTLSGFPAGGYEYAGYNIALQEYYDDLRVGIYHSSSLIEGNADFLNFTGSAVKSITTTTINGKDGVLIEIEGGGSADTFPYTGSAEITGSLGLTGSFQVESGSTKPFTINEDGTVQLFSHINSYNPTAVLGGIYFTSQSVYFGLEE